MAASPGSRLRQQERKRRKRDKEGKEEMDKIGIICA